MRISTSGSARPSVRYLVITPSGSARCSVRIPTTTMLPGYHPYHATWLSPLPGSGVTWLSPLPGAWRDHVTWLSPLPGAWRDHELDELRWSPSSSSADWSPAYPCERGHATAPTPEGGAAAAAAESAAQQDEREAAAAELRKRTWAAFESVGMPV